MVQRILHGIYEFKLSHPSPLSCSSHAIGTLAAMDAEPPARPSLESKPYYNPIQAAPTFLGRAAIRHHRDFVVIARAPDVDVPHSVFVTVSPIDSNSEDDSDKYESCGVRRRGHPGSVSVKSSSSSDGATLAATTNTKLERPHVDLCHVCINFIQCSRIRRCL